MYSNLKNATCYPVPCRPSRGQNEIHFTRLTENASIKIWNIAGELIRQIDNVNGQATWDLRNDYGEKVASGIYIFIIRSKGGQKKTGKLAIIR